MLRHMEEFLQDIQPIAHHAAEEVRNNIGKNINIVDNKVAVVIPTMIG